MVEVFKTNVAESAEAEKLIKLLRTYIPDGRINFDLDDCDKVLRIEGYSFKPDIVIRLIESRGMSCCIMEH